MTNEILLIISLFFSYSLVIVFYKLSGKTGLFTWISICTILANIEVTILIRAFNLEQTLGNTLFASSFLATDILSEKFGKEESKKGVLIGTATSIVFIIFSFIWIHYIPSENDLVHSSIKSIFSSTPRILIASLIAYVISEYLDVNLYHFFWKLTEKKSGNSNKYLWFRNNAATLISQAVNIVLFNFGAFLGIYDFNTLFSITISCYIIYIFTSLLDTPFIYLAKKL